MPDGFCICFRRRLSVGAGIEALFGQFGGAQYGAGLVQSFGPFRIRVRIGHDAGPGLNVQLLVLDLLQGGGFLRVGRQYGGSAEGSSECSSKGKSVHVVSCSGKKPQLGFGSTVYAGAVPATAHRKQKPSL